MMNYLQMSGTEAYERLTKVSVGSKARALILSVCSLVIAGCETSPFGRGADQQAFGRFQAASVGSITPSSPLPAVTATSTATREAAPQTSGPTDLRLASQSATSPPNGSSPSGNVMPAGSSAATRYKVNSGDVLEIAVYPIDDLKRRVEVDAAGLVNLPLIGEANVAGKSTLEIARELADRYRGRYVRDPNVSVLVVEKVSQRFTIAGGVERPGLFPIEGPVSITQAVALAGGIKRGSNPSTITLSRPVGDTVQTYTYGRYDLEAGKIADPQLIAGDRIVVEQRENKVTVSGAVTQTGVYEWTPGLSLSAAIALAKGVTVMANNKEVLILREINGEIQAARFDLLLIQKGASEDPILVDGDRIFVGTDATRNAILTWAPVVSFLNVFAIFNGN